MSDWIQFHPGMHLRGTRQGGGEVGVAVGFFKEEPINPFPSYSLFNIVQILLLFSASFYASHFLRLALIVVRCSLLIRTVTNFKERMHPPPKKKQYTRSFQRGDRKNWFSKNLFVRPQKPRQKLNVSSKFLMMHPVPPPLPYPPENSSGSKLFSVAFKTTALYGSWRVCALIFSKGTEIDPRWWGRGDSSALLCSPHWKTEGCVL